MTKRKDKVLEAFHEAIKQNGLELEGIIFVGRKKNGHVVTSHHSEHELSDVLLINEGKKLEKMHEVKMLQEIALKLKKDLPKPNMNLPDRSYLG